jgi:hypothetical protein
MSIDWGAVHQRLLGRPAGVPESKEQQLLGRFLRAFERVVLKQGSAFVRQVAVEADNAGVPLEWLPYVFFVIREQRRDWPPMGAGAERALGVGRDIMEASGSTPSYREILGVPPSEIESALDAALQRLATWCLSTLAISIGKGFADLLKKYARPIEKLREDIPKGKGTTYLRAVATQALNDNPTRFPNGLLLWDVLYSLL